MIESIFKELKIVELASVLAGPAVGMFFAEMGAEVIKIENKKTAGDITRTWHIAGEDKTKDAAYFHAVNYGKDHVLLDLNQEEDRSILMEHLKDTDILISNFPQRVTDKFGLDHATLCQAFPQLIYAHLGGFESNERLAYDIVLQAETGFLSMNGLDEANKCKMPVALIDILAAHQLKEAILIALLQRNATNKGAYVSTNLERSAISSLANQATNYLNVGHIAKPIGSAHPNIAPYGDIYTTSDGKEIVFAVGSDQQFAALCSILNVESLIHHPKFQSNAARVENREELIGLLQEQLNSISCSALNQACIDAKIPMGIIKNLQEVFEQEYTKDMLLHSEDADGKSVSRVKSIAFQIQKI